ncbi:MAG: peptidyl-tRNA hydrolase [Thermomicrobiales bacterium]|nr:MAG: peptidyl-tRNA hydrolase [Thermomicrobiales bacterium]
MKIVVGLGNPGREYAETRHNIGFMVVDRLARLAGAAGWKRRFQSELCEVVIDGERLVLAKPQTYMNLSGHAVRQIAQWYRVPVSDLLIIYDDLDLPFGVLRMRARGSAGGHRGLASIIEQLGTQEIPRLRIGIGRGPGEATAHVLSRFSPEEAARLPLILDRAVEAVRLWLTAGITAAMNEINRRGAIEQVQVVAGTRKERA